MCSWLSSWMVGVECWVSVVWLICMIVCFIALGWAMSCWIKNPPDRAPC